MFNSSAGKTWPSVDEVVEAYELAQVRDGRADIAHFSPAADHPEYLAILCELVRVDLEYGWRRGGPRPLSYYERLFPALFRDDRLVREISYEEMRLRLQSEEDASFEVLTDPPPTRPTNGSPTGVEPVDGSDAKTPSPHSDSRISRTPKGRTDLAAAAYRAFRQGRDDDPTSLEAVFASRRVAGAEADLFRSLHAVSPPRAERLARALVTLPEPGTDFLGFHLKEELGRGAFGRVYLAHQGDLANRLVALKVSADAAIETHALARLQHTNIVPIYSVHQSGALQAVCMPYLGATTLADVLKELRRHETLPDSGLALLSSRRTRVPSAEDQRLTHLDGGETSASVAANEQDAASHSSDASARPSAQVERLRGLGYTQAVLWLISHATEGLAHAHERGILHRDLKPANVLFSDDGEPLLLDFNLATDTRLHVQASAAMVGGTLPYLAPEHLEAFQRPDRTIDARADLFAMGVILYELLTGRHPFDIPHGTVDEIIPPMIAERRTKKIEPRRWNKQISPAVASIVAKCLSPDLNSRYQSARELQEDLRRQLENEPLKYAPDRSIRERTGKWARRHPRLTSSTAVIFIAVGLLTAVVCGFTWRQSHLARLEARDSLHKLSEDVTTAGVLLSARDSNPLQFEEGQSLCRQSLERYHVLDDPRWRDRPAARLLAPADRDRLFRVMGELLLLYSRAVSWECEARSDPAGRAKQLKFATRLSELADSCFGSENAPRALWLQQSDIAKAEGRDVESERLLKKAESVALRSSRDRFWVVEHKLDGGERRNLLPTVAETTRLEPRNYANWLLLGNCYARIGYSEEALLCFEHGIAMHPDLDWTYFNRGLLYLDMKNPRKAIEDFDRVIALRPNRTEAYINRGLAQLELGDFAASVTDLTTALEDASAPTRTWFIRATAHERSGDREAAARDRAEGLKRQPRDELSWVARGLARLPRDPRGALADFDAALLLNPRSRHALQDKASVLSEQLGQTEEAIRTLDRLLDYHPEFVDALAGRGVLLARLGRRDAAHRDARAALAASRQPAARYQVAGIYALTSKQVADDRRESLRLLSDAIREDPKWLRVVSRDPDLDPIRDRSEFQELMRALTLTVSMADEASNQRKSFQGRK
jgi:eukaryotic-like serine/threonine-protein kinase